MSFFTAQEQMPAGKGFALFHGQHVAILLLIGGVLACGVWRYRKSVHRNAWRWGIVMTLCLLEVLKQVVLLTTHQFGKQYLPFDLCGISILFCLLEIWKPCAYFGELLYSLSLPGTLLALFSRTGIGCRCGTFSVSIVFYFIRCCCCCLYCCWRTERCNRIGNGCRCRF